MAQTTGSGSVHRRQARPEAWVGLRWGAAAAWLAMHPRAAPPFPAAPVVRIRRRELTEARPETVLQSWDRTRRGRRCGQRHELAKSNKFRLGQFRSKRGRRRRRVVLGWYARRGRQWGRKQHSDGQRRLGRRILVGYRNRRQGRRQSTILGPDGDGGNATATANASAAGGGTAMANSAATGGVGGAGTLPEQAPRTQRRPPRPQRAR